MNFIHRLIAKFDAYQQGHAWAGFPYAVIKKYGQDQAGYQVALLTYYAFLSLFPLLLVLTTLAGILAGHSPHAQSVIVRGLTSYFPLLGSQLAQHIHSLHKNGIALIVGVIFTLYGARGVASVFMNGVNHIWQIPLTKRDGFPKSTLKSLLLIVIGGIGFMAASLLAGYAGTVGHGLIFRLLSLIVNVFVLFWLFLFVLRVSLPKRVNLKGTAVGAGFAAFGLVILQSVGSYLLTRELKDLDALYANFALALGLLYWLYLQAQVVYYSIEIDAVRVHRLWPRAIVADNLTTEDKQAYSGQAKKEQVIPDETVATSFIRKKSKT